MNKCFDTLIMQMQDELKGADEYINEALCYKDKDRILADTYYDLSLQEMKHKEMLYAQAQRILKEYETKEDYKQMKEIFEWVCNKYSDWVKRIKLSQITYKE